ncbi:MAG: nucleotidyltransferase domain-containing protein [Lachnospiraceae bacterium]|nr:nucleotidyltransferase domain-containing protein [Lachnospiraceae bacterium]
MQVNVIIEMIVEICQKYSADQVILFGSRAKGTALDRSDIDIAVSGVKDFETMREEVEALPTLFKIDVVNLDICMNEDLLEDIKKYGKKIYQKISVV